MSRSMMRTIATQTGRLGVAALLFTTATLLTQRAAAQTSEPSSPPADDTAVVARQTPVVQMLPPKPRPPRETISNHYVELTMGFIAGGRRYSDASFASQDSSAPAFVEPFNNAPFNSANAFGLRYDLRAIVSYVRMTIGIDIPFPAYRIADTQANYMLNGMTHAVSVQSLHPYELRFGIGGEYPIWIFAPFLDLLGTAYWANTSLSVDDNKADYQAQGFGFSLRAGCRVHLRSWFFTQLSGDIGVYGPVVWNAELSIGFAIGRHQFK